MKSNDSSSSLAMPQANAQRGYDWIFSTFLIIRNDEEETNEDLTFKKMANRP